MIDTENTLVIIRGAGDLATGIAVRLHNSGFPLIMLDIEKPTVIRRNVSFAEALFSGETTVEGIKAKATSVEEAKAVASTGLVAVVADPEGKAIGHYRPDVVVDAILAKRNLGTALDMAPLTIGVGPGFEAGKDTHYAIETCRGHRLGRIISSGSALPNTGIPGIIGGYGKERVMHTTSSGIFRSNARIGDIVEAGSIVAYVDEVPVYTTISGKVRGMLHDGLWVPSGFKVADVDPRGESVDHTTVSDKAFAIAGGVLECILHYLTGKKA